MSVLANEVHDDYDKLISQVFAMLRERDCTNVPQLIMD